MSPNITLASCESLIQSRSIPSSLLANTIVSGCMGEIVPIPTLAGEPTRFKLLVCKWSVQNLLASSSEGLLVV